MYTGHFAIGLALKEHKPEIPAMPILAGVVLLDILNSFFLLIGLNRVSSDMSALPYMYFKLDFIDWDHSLLMALIWSVLWGILFIRFPKTALIAFLAVFSHFLADLLVHNHDMALFPYSDTHLGFGLWGTLGSLSWWLEGIFSLALFIYAFRKARKRGISYLFPGILMILMFIFVSPYFSVMKFAASLSHPYNHIVLAIQFLTGMLIPALLLIAYYNKVEKQAM